MSDPLSRVFAALADPTRRDLVARLAAGDATVGQLAAPYDVTVQAVSKHLKVLEDAGPGQPRRRRAAAPGAPRGRGVRPDDRVDRALPAARPRSATGASTPCWPSMDDDRDRTTEEGASMMTTDHRTTTARSRPTRRCRSSGSPGTSRPPRRSCSGRTPTRSCSPAGSGRTARRPRIDALGRPHRRQLALRRQPATATSSASTAASTRSARTGSCRPSPSRAMPDGVALETLTLRRPRRRPHPAARAVAGATASRAATPGCAAAWRPASTRATPSSTRCWPMAVRPDRRPPSGTAPSPAAFTDRVRGTRDWDAPAPVAGWTARDVVGHLTEWLPAFLAGGAGIELPADRRRTMTRSPPGRPTPTRSRPCSTTRPADRLLQQPAHRRACRWTRRSTASTPPTSSCTPGTWPAPPARTTGSTRVLRRAAGRDGADRGAAPVVGPVRRPRAGARRRRRADPADRLHRPRPSARVMATPTGRTAPGRRRRAGPSARRARGPPGPGPTSRRRGSRPA